MQSRTLTDGVRLSLHMPEAESQIRRFPGFVSPKIPDAIFAKDVIRGLTDGISHKKVISGIKSFDSPGLKLAYKIVPLYKIA